MKWASAACETIQPHGRITLTTRMRTPSKASRRRGPPVSGPAVVRPQLRRRGVATVFASLRHGHSPWLGLGAACRCCERRCAAVPGRPRDLCAAYRPPVGHASKGLASKQLKSLMFTVRMLGIFHLESDVKSSSNLAIPTGSCACCKAISWPISPARACYVIPMPLTAA